MCETKRRFLRLFFVCSLLVFTAGALQAGDAMYLISEAELSSIERYKTKSEAEKQDWLLQARILKTRAENLLKESETLNSQLAVQRELNRNLQTSFDTLEAGRLILISARNGEIAALKLEAERQKTKAARMLAIIIMLAGTITAYAVVKIFFKK